MLKQDILSILEENRGELVTGGALATRYQVSRTAVWKAIHSLQQEGNAIESVQGSGYRLAPDSDGLSEAGIRVALRTKRFGKAMELLRSVPSTNEYIKGLDPQNLEEGFVTVADGQTGGRGRRGRGFLSPAGEGVYLSVLLKPDIPPRDIPFLTICAAVAAALAVEEVCGARIFIKWVNDLYHGGKKLAGILTEAIVTAELQTVEYAVVGIGINTGIVPEEVAAIATSTQVVTGRRGYRNRLIAAVLKHLEEIYLGYTDTGKREPVLSAYSERLWGLGRAAEILDGRERCVAAVTGVDSDGALLIRDGYGTNRRVISGEILRFLEERQ